MCQLCAYAAKRRKDLRPYLAEFFSHCEENPHGWGVADFDGGGVAIEKEPVKASESERLKAMLAEPVLKRNFFAHIRHATVGQQAWQNCHPFTGADWSGRQWTLMHNGSLFEKTSADGMFAKQSGDTDSERILLYVVRRMDEAIARANRSLYADERFDILEAIIRELAPGNKLNLVIHDGERIYVHCNEKGTLYFRPLGGGKLIATVPLLGGPWRPVPLTRLVALKDGRVERIAPPHGNVYVPDPEKIAMLYLNFANL